MSRFSRSLALGRLTLAGCAAVVALPLLAGGAVAQAPAPTQPAPMARPDGAGPWANKPQRQLTPEQQKKMEERRAAHRAIFTPEQQQKLDQAKAMRDEVMTTLTPEQRAKLKEMRRSHRGEMFGPGMGPGGRSGMGPGYGPGPGAGLGAAPNAPVGDQLNSGQGATPAR